MDKDKLKLIVRNLELLVASLKSEVYSVVDVYKHSKAYDSRLTDYDSLYEQNKLKEAPFKDTWHKLAINKSVIDAVEKGDDGIALTLGKTHTDRYGEGEVFKEKFNVLYDKKGKSYLNKLAKKYGLTVETKPLKIKSNYEMFEDLDETFYVLKFNYKLKKDIRE